MRCRCGNETGEPRVNPFEVSFIDSRSHQEIWIAYNGGFSSTGRCWFCEFPRRLDEQAR